MGATWFNDIHVSFRNLYELGLEHFEQFMTAPISKPSAAPAKFKSTKQSKIESQAAQPNSLKP
jgi:hypothetical protein